MNSRKHRILLCVIGILALVICMVVGTRREGGQEAYEKPIVIDVFDSVANYQGIQSGWFASVVKKQFNMELNIIAPNVAGGGNMLFEINSAAGNLGDLIICNGENDNIQKMVNSGLVVNMEPYLADKDIMRFESAIRKLNEGVTPEGIYAIPTEMSINSPLTPSESIDFTYGPYLRWDLYKACGYPKMDTLEDLLPVLKKMQELEPYAENGERTYGFSFFKDWDGNLMNAAKQPCCFYGYDELGFVLEKADGSDYQSIMDSDSLYIRMLKLYYNANQMGLVDPQSPTQKYGDFARKHADGQVLYSPWPWVAKQQYNTLSRMQEGKGFMLADIADMQIYSYGCSREGKRKMVLLVGARMEDPQRLVDLIDWLYSPDGISSTGVQSSAKTAGPRGLCWDYGEDGQPYLTEFGQQALLYGEAKVPEEYGGGIWKEGFSMLNFMQVSPCELDADGYPYAYSLWDSVMEMDVTEVERDWSEVMQADNTREFLLKNDRLLVSPGCSCILPPEGSETATMREQCRTVIQRYSWDMIFAKDEKEFYRLLEKMQNEVKRLGYETVLEVDMKNALDYQRQRERAVEEYMAEEEADEE